MHYHSSTFNIAITPYSFAFLGIMLAEAIAICFFHRHINKYRFRREDAWVYISFISLGIVVFLSSFVFRALSHCPAYFYSSLKPFGLIILLNAVIGALKVLDSSAEAEGKLTEEAKNNGYLLIVAVLLSINCLGIWANSEVIQKILYSSVTCIHIFFCRKELSPKILAASVCIIIFFPFNGAYSAIPILVALSPLLIHKSRIDEFTLAWGIIYSAIVILQSQVPFCWNLVRNTSRAITYSLTFGSILGPSLSSFIPYASAVLAAAITAASKEAAMKKNMLRFMIIVFRIAVAYTVYLNLFVLLLAAAPAIAANAMFLGVWLIVPAIQAEGLHASNKMQSSFDERPQHIAAVPLAAVLLITAFVDFSPLALKSSPPKTAIVGTAAFADIDVAPMDAGSLGYAYSNTTFGMVALYLEEFNCDSYICKSIGDIVWEETDLVILIHYNEEFSENARRQMRDFVQSGGSVIAISDHTNIFNSMAKTNELLSYSGLSINDDISDNILHHYGKVWGNSLSLFDCFVNSHIDAIDQIGVWGGASVSGPLFAQPLVAAKYGNSDPANPFDLEGRLGNRMFDIGEEAGDMPLVYRAFYGNGSVTVFGDASYFQMPSHVSNWEFVNKIIRDTSTAKVLSKYSPMAQVISLLVAAMLGWAVFSRKSLDLSVKFRSFALTLLLSTIASTAINSGMYAYYSRSLVQQFRGNSLVIQAGSGNYFSSSMMSEDQAIGLGFIGIKNGIPAFVSKYNAPLNCKLFVIINPRKKISQKYANNIIDFVSKGGNVLLIAGYEYKDSVEHLLSPFEISYRPEFLGPLPWLHYSLSATLDISGPQFNELWKVDYNNTATKPFYQYENYVACTVTAVGAGKIYFIPDSRYVSSANLEGELDGNRNNIDFVTSIIQDAFQ
ncbi:MAG: hypothetical protein FWG30_08310 [Eubacteriaceae bacterium]|nr:hypothetical protein [Eubacteriaceae bacterium]